ncbi:uncharacterized protein BT62DRAFT_923283 [Guyanagaster necrorhizus]|uniref:Uncharacterized protein n=1 Tax=Guyanagaster necrorhizus TaxID=856835 RepID=A0A9P7VK86_9AGAR|nr:uncharacterized protein BT62DRAFT_923283 [Guyanagaster necrorhizus MCA 3950]KAG7441506.1 hypothetical protein BT62DRAFT_923283 [Guyanagaster necrorhizus MCA 3950]
MSTYRGTSYCNTNYGTNILAACLALVKRRHRRARLPSGVRQLTEVRIEDESSNAYPKEVLDPERFIRRLYAPVGIPVTSNEGIRRTYQYTKRSTIFELVPIASLDGIIHIQDEPSHRDQNS